MVGTLYAPGISKQEGWKDATKLWRNHDSGLCFAAFRSNLISWYLERYIKQHPEDTNVYETDVEKVFDRFRRGWDSAVGGDQKKALSWYFTGGFPSGSHNPAHSELTGKEKGGYLKGKIPNNTSDQWSYLSFDWKPEEIFSVFGGYSDNRFPFIEELSGMTGTGAFATLEGFSKEVIRQLHYGACTISIVADKASGGSGHAITLWGVDYDVDTGLVTAIHVTDSDDTRREMFTVPIERGNQDGGVRLVNYPYHPPTGGYQRFTRIRDSIVLYSPEGVRLNQDYIGDDAVISALNPDSDGCAVDVQVSNISNHLLEYGYSYDKNPDNVVRWQSDSHFSDLKPEQYYFFPRVKETSEHNAGGVSAPVSYRVKTPSPTSQEPVASLGLGTSIFRPYNGTHQYIWYGTEGGLEENEAEESILWRVLDTQTNHNTEGIFLLSDRLYGTGKNGGLSFSEQTPYNNTYQNSSAKRWCQDFQTKHFEALEQAAILLITKSDKQYSNGVTFEESSNILSSDKVFLPSAEEIANEIYGFGTEESRQGRYHDGSFGYWLRSPVMNGNDKAGYVNSAGNVVHQYTTNHYAARPAFNLDGNKVLYATAVGNGQFANEIGLEKIQTVNSQDFRVVLKDMSRNFHITSSEITAQPSEPITLGYEGAKIGQTDNECISVILTDDNGTTPIYYGKLTLVQDVNGEVSFKLPEDLTVSAPVTGQKPQNAESSEDGYTIERTTWTPNHDVFQANTQYEVSVFVKTKPNYTFTDTTIFKFNGQSITPVINGEEYIITYTDFPKTEEDKSDSGTDSSPDSGSDSSPDSGSNSSPNSGSNSSPNSGSDSSPNSGSDSSPDSGSNSSPDSGSDSSPNSGTDESVSSESTKPEVSEGLDGNKVEIVPQPNSTKAETTVWSNEKKSATKTSKDQNSNLKDELAVSNQVEEDTPEDNKTLESTPPMISDKNTESAPVTEPHTSEKESQPSSQPGHFGWVALGVGVPSAGLTLFLVLKKILKLKH